MRQKLPLTPHMRERARELRETMTDAEQHLWFFLRNRRLLGMKFRRQVAVPPYVLDFYCADFRLVIELDGGQHNEAGSDVRRDAWLLQRNIRVLRFWSSDVMNDVESVLEAIRLEIERLSLTPSPSPEGRGEEPREE